MTDQFDESLKPYFKAVLGKKAEDVVALDVRNLTSYTDVFIICSARSSRQASAIAEYIKVELKKSQIAPLSIEGMTEGQWVLMDYGNVIIHVFYEDTRGFYDLEGLWADARKIDIGVPV